MQYTYLIAGGIAVIVIFAVLAFASRRAAYLEEETAEVETWFKNQQKIFPLRPLKAEQVAVVKSVMDDDHDLWCLLGYDSDDFADRDACYQEVLSCGRYFRIFGPLDLYQTQYEPRICYGVFEDNPIGPSFRAWIEFHYNGTLWVISENYDRKPEVTRFSNYRVNHPGIVHRHAVEFAYDSLDTRLSRHSPTGT